MTDKEYYELLGINPSGKNQSERNVKDAARFGLTIPQYKKMVAAFRMLYDNCIRYPLCWKDLEGRRPIARNFYESCGTLNGGMFKSSDALLLEAKNNLLKKQGREDEIQEKTTKDHIRNPQMYFYYLAEFAEKFSTLELFFPQWKMCSTTITVTQSENDALSDCSSKEGKVLVTLDKRYELCVSQLWSKETGQVIDKFPYGFDEDHLKWEMENQLIIDAK